MLKLTSLNLFLCLQLKVSLGRLFRVVCLGAIIIMILSSQTQIAPFCDWVVRSRFLQYAPFDVMCSTLLRKFPDVLGQFCGVWYSLGLKVEQNHTLCEVKKSALQCKFLRACCENLAQILSHGTIPQPRCGVWIKLNTGRIEFHAGGFC